MRPELRHPTARASATMPRPAADRAEIASAGRPSPVRWRARDHGMKASRVDRNEAVRRRRSLRARPEEEFQKPPNCFIPRSEEHTSELQSHSDLVCRLLLEKKKL